MLPVAPGVLLVAAATVVVVAVVEPLTIADDDAADPLGGPLRTAKCSKLRV